jgi:hypothetical protein
MEERHRHFVSRRGVEDIFAAGALEDDVEHVPSVVASVLNRAALVPAGKNKARIDELDGAELFIAGSGPALVVPVFLPVVFLKEAREGVDERWIRHAARDIGRCEKRVNGEGKDDAEQYHPCDAVAPQVDFSVHGEEEQGAERDHDGDHIGKINELHRVAEGGGGGPLQQEVAREAGVHGNPEVIAHIVDEHKQNRQKREDGNAHDPSGFFESLFPDNEDGVKRYPRKKRRAEGEYGLIEKAVQEEQGRGLRYDECGIHPEHVIYPYSVDHAEDEHRVKEAE